MATTIATNVGTASGAATGNPGQGHLIYSANTGKWYCFYLSSTQTLNLAYASAINATWTVSSAPFTLANAHNQEGRCFGFNNVSIGGADYVHMNSTYAVTTSSTKSYHARFKLDNGVNPNTGWTTTNSETSETSRNTSSSGIPSGASVIIDSAGKVAECNSFISSSSNMTDQRFLQYPNADTAATWTIGTPANNVSFTNTTYVTSNAFADLGGSNLLNVCDNANSTGGMTQLEWSKWNGSSWSAAATALSATITPTSTCNWGMVARTTTEVHVVVLSNNSSTFIHRIFNGTSWSNGASIATLALQTNSGVFLATDGTSVWAIVIDSTNRIAYTKYSGGTWSAWATLEAAGATNRFRVTGYPTVAAGGIGVIWTEVNGSNFNIVASVLGMPQTSTLATATANSGTVAVGTAEGNVNFALPTGDVPVATVSLSGAPTGTASSSPSVVDVTAGISAITGAPTGTVSTTLDISNVVADTPAIAGAAGVAAAILPTTDVAAGTDVLTAGGTGNTSFSLAMGAVTAGTVDLTGSGSGNTSSALLTDDVTIGTVAIGATGTGNTSFTLPGSPVTASTVALTGSGGPLSSTLPTADVTIATAILTASGTGIATSSISVNDVPVGTSSLSGAPTGSVNASFSTIDVPITVSISGGPTGSILRSIDVPNIPVATSVLTGAPTGTVTSSLPTDDVAASTVALSGIGTGNTSISLPTDDVTTATVDIAGTTGGAASLPFVDVGAGTADLTASGSGTASFALTTINVAAGIVTLSGSPSGSVTAALPVTNVSIATADLTGAATGSAARSMVVSDVAILGLNMTGSQQTRQYPLSFAAVSASTSALSGAFSGSATVPLTLANIGATGSLAGGLASGIFSVSPELTTLLN